jgi:hypothetical protein
VGLSQTGCCSKLVNILTLAGDCDHLFVVRFEFPFLGPGRGVMTMKMLSRL